MDIIHRISINSIKDAEFMSAVIELGLNYKEIELPGGRSQLITFIIEESDPQWKKISELVEIYGAVNIVETTFTEEEIQNAEWLRLTTTFEQGYPQPQKYWPFKQSNLEIICSNCAVYRQIAPMRLSKEPSLGKNSFMSLIWGGEVFCTSEVILGLESIRAKGYEARDVIIHKTNQPSEKIYQLYVPGMAKPGLVLEDEWPRKSCTMCGTIKYYPHTKGIMNIQRKALIPGLDFIVTYEWFGHGLLAWREMLVSNRVAKMILDQGWQGVRFKVVNLV